MIDVILVPQGAEYQAVNRGLRHCQKSPIVVAIPVGKPAVQRFLSEWQPQPEQSILVMGLCGSLSSAHPVGEVLLYESCWNAIDPSWQSCDRALTDWMSKRVAAPLVRGFTSERVVHTAAEKQILAGRYAADAVDMEGSAILQAISQNRVAMLRVVSDDCAHDLPDLSHAISPDGNLLPLPLLLALLQRPIAAFRLIRGSLRGLAALQQVTTQLFA